MFNTLSSHLRRLLGFAALPALSLLAPLLLLPLVSSRFGSLGWSSVGLGQGAGALASVAIGLSWPVSGGHAIASAETKESRRALYGQSMASRAVVAVVVLPLAVAAAVVLSPGFALATALFAIGISLNGFTASWYWSGLGIPRGLVLNEGVPRLIAYGLALLGVGAGLGMAWYGFTICAGGITGILLNWRSAMGRWSVKPASGDSTDLKSMLSLKVAARGTVGRLVQACYYFGATSVVTAMAVPSFTEFIAVDQLQKASNNGLGILPQAFIAWIGSDAIRRRQRQRAAILGLFFTALLLLVSWQICASYAIRILFSSRLELSPPQIFFVGLTIVTYFLCRSLELLILVPNGLSSKVWSSALAFSVAGLLGLVVAAADGQLTPLLVASALVQTAQLVYYLSSRHVLRSGRILAS